MHGQSERRWWIIRGGEEDLAAQGAAGGRKGKLPGPVVYFGGERILHVGSSIGSRTIGIAENVWLSVAV